MPVFISSVQIFPAASFTFRFTHVKLLSGFVKCSHRSFASLAILRHSQLCRSAPCCCSFIFQSFCGNRLLHVFHQPILNCRFFHQKRHLSASLTRKLKTMCARLRPCLPTSRAGALDATSTVADNQVLACNDSVSNYSSAFR